MQSKLPGVGPSKQKNKRGETLLKSGTGNAAEIFPKQKQRKERYIIGTGYIIEETMPG